MKKYLLSILVLIAILIYGCAQQTDTPTTVTEPEPIVDETPVEPGVEEAVVEETTGEPKDAVETKAEEPKTLTVTEPTTVDIDISGFAFNPATITIKKGTTIRWTQKDSTRHSATSDDGVFDSQLLSQDKTWRHTFNDTGTFKYHCRPHPSMKGEVIVE